MSLTNELWVKPTQCLAVSLARLSALFCLFFATCFPPMAWTAPVTSGEIPKPETPWYNIELIIFGKSNTRSDSEEFWPERDRLDLSIPESSTDYQNALANQSIIALRTSNEFLSIERKLVRRNASRILFKETWQQQIHDDRLTRPWYVTGGDQIEGMDEVEAYLKISLKRYLHIDLDLRLHRFGVPPKKSRLVEQFTNTGLPSNGDPNTNHSAWPTNEAANTGLSEQPLTQSSAIQILETIQLKQKRRMRSKEIHYIDHPLLGVIVRISPIQTSNEVSLNKTK